MKKIFTTAAVIVAITTPAFAGPAASASKADAVRCTNLVVLEPGAELVLTKSTAKSAGPCAGTVIIMTDAGPVPEGTVLEKQDFSGYKS